MNEKMKDSGIQWIGEIPERWKVIKAKYYSYMKGRIGWQGLMADEFTEDGPYLITGTDFDNGRVYWDRSYHITIERYNEAPQIQVQEGDLLVTKDGTIGKLAYIDSLPDKASLNSHLLLIRPIRGKYINKYLYWILSSSVFVDYYELVSSGSTMSSISQEKLENFTFPLPSLEHQQAIATFLDSTCSQVDGIITDLEHQVDLLKEYKKSLITETVTKGLDKHVKLKDSGIAWIGKIPEHWEVTRLKYISKFKTGGTPDDKSGINTENDGFPWITAPDITDSLDIRNYSQYITDKSVKLHRYSLFPANSILLVCIASVGKIGMLHEYGYANQQITAIMSNNCILPRYLLFYLNSVATKISADASSNVVPIINTRYLSNISVILPSLEQQQDIASFLDTRCAEIDSIIKGKEEQIEQQKEYKKSLIYEYVTGKKRVKEVY